MCICRRCASRERPFCNQTAQLGYLLSIPQTGSSNTDIGPGYDFVVSGCTFELLQVTSQFVSDGRMFFKSARTRDLDNDLGDIRCDILGLLNQVCTIVALTRADMESKIMRNIQNEVLRCSKTFLKLGRASAEIDWFGAGFAQVESHGRSIAAFASAAKEYKYIRPTISTDGKSRIKAGRWAHCSRHCLIVLLDAKHARAGIRFKSCLFRRLCRTTTRVEPTSALSRSSQARMPAANPSTSSRSASSTSWPA